MVYVTFNKSDSACRHTPNLTNHMTWQHPFLPIQPSRFHLVTTHKKNTWQKLTLRSHVQRLPNQKSFKCLTETSKNWSQNCMLFLRVKRANHQVCTCALTTITTDIRRVSSLRCDCKLFCALACLILS